MPGPVRSIVLIPGPAFPVTCTHQLQKCGKARAVRASRDRSDDDPSHGGRLGDGDSDKARSNRLAGGRNGDAKTCADHMLDMILAPTPMTRARLDVGGEAETVEQFLEIASPWARIRTRSSANADAGISASSENRCPDRHSTT